MRKVSLVSLALAFGFVLAACGGDDAQPPKTPTTPPVATATPTVTPTAEPPKEEVKKESPMELQKKTMTAFGEAMQAKDAKKLAGLYAENAVVKMAGAPSDTTGREAIQQNFQKMFDAYSDYKAAASRVFVKGDVAIVEWAFNGTHTGDLMGIKATEKKVGAQGLDVTWFNEAGQIKEQHVYFDVGTILSQIGVSKQKARGIPAVPSGKPEVMVSTNSPDEAKNTEAVKTMTAALEAKKEADFVGTIADTVEYDDMTMPQTMKGKADAKKFFKEMTTGFPDAKQTINNTFAVGDFVISEGTMTGTHKGAFFGIQPTKKPVTLKVVDIFQFKDGKMVRGWAYSNGADMAMQLGLMPKPGEAKPGAAGGDKKPDAAAKPGDAAKPAGDKKPEVKPADKK